MKGHGRDLGDIVALLEKPRRGFVPQVVETQVLDPERAAGAGKGRAYGFRVVGEDPVLPGDPRLSLHHVPGLAQRRERLMVADLGPGCFASLSIAVRFTLSRSDHSSRVISLSRFVVRMAKVTISLMGMVERQAAAE